MPIPTGLDDADALPGDLVSVEAFTAMATALNYLIDCAGVGKISMMLYGLTGVPAPNPKYWQLCDGSLITDPDSPLRGGNTPNLGISTVTLNNLAYTAKVGGTVTVSYIQYIPAVPAVGAYLAIQSVQYFAQTAGAAGNNITIEYLLDGPFLGGVSVTVAGTAITVHLPGVDFGGDWLPGAGATQSAIVSAVNASTPAHALVNAVLGGPDGVITYSFPYPEATVPATHLAGGIDLIPAIGAAGHEVVTVSGQNITVRLQSGVSTIADIQAAINSSIASFYVSCAFGSGLGGTTQTAPANCAMMPGVYLKGASAEGTAGVLGGSNFQQIAHDHGGTGFSYNWFAPTHQLGTFFVTGDYDWVDHVHPVPVDLAAVSFEPAHIPLRYYLKIN